MARLLLVEDDPTLALSLRLALTDQGHAVTAVGTLARATAATDADEPGFDLIVLDLGLPDGDGLELCARLRARGDFVPIIALTARHTLEARVAGLRSGADDYVTKPFDLPELVARIDALLRRCTTWPTSAAATSPSDETRIGRLVVDFRRREAACDGEAVALSDLELRLLMYLLARAGEVVTREALLVDVWELPASSRTRTIDTFIYRLRKLIEPDPAHPRYLQSLRGAGYRLDRA
ncbi:MAG: response regulator transcription factor [Myxococcales bacterium]|nr:response regulator transcription factor [Myxococcales bacterium]MCB9733252.1 response regulator transcription factor [Deltaproteobacteria bacterium]